ncbi:Acetyltransferase (GNAT) domain-containing protein [Ruegeria halocynthiae]|uniref:Acetyltransferase (GNAT) domain-containing protein n=1 Tax=Ruegeria halocynthiae TaxID=985054 RepID=A0A1H2TWM8_9RHOB|nr:GNAT family N-acetyltransferase [Ruegeria halocynthiae]SDW48315.1 Acetyltransferase (GNAT) domain-containing protein [Ruegeria halocynthiae]
MTEFNLRAAVAEDVGAIRGCLAESYAGVRREIEDLPDVTSGILDDIKERQVLIAEDSMCLLGVIIYGEESDAMMIFNLGVSPKAQGRGIARRLLAAAEKSAKTGEIQTLRLRTHRLMSDTRAMYRHLGWQELEISGNTVLMQKRVT